MCIRDRSGCGSGTEYLAVTPWGDFYPCHQFVGNEKFLLGNVDEGIKNTEIRDEFKCCNVYAKEKCRKCLDVYKRQVHNAALETESESCMSCRTIFAEIQIKLIIFFF